MKCRICESKNLDLVFDLGDQPWGNNFLTVDEIGKEKSYPLELIYCNNCSLSQLSYTVKKEVMFSDHTYLSGMTSSLANHFKNVANLLNDRFNEKKEKKNILDLGSNDGTFLKQFNSLGWNTLGVESSYDISKIANKNGIKTLNKFFNHKVAEEINQEFDFINASGVFFHLQELHSFTQGVKKLLSKDGIFIVQFLYMKQIMKNVAFDQIYHEHLLYYNLKTLDHLLSIYDLEIFDANLSEIHGGQMNAFVAHKGSRQKTKNYLKILNEEIKENANSKSSYIKFEKNSRLLKEKNLLFFEKALQSSKKIFGLGAPVKGNTLINYFGITKKMMPKLLEINPLRKNLYAPGSHIPVIMEDEEKELPHIYYVLAWNFKDEILRKNKKLQEDGIDFYFPIEVNNK